MNDTLAKPNQRRIPPVALLPGAILLLIGVGFLLNNFGVLHLDFAKLWPVLLIAVGLVNMAKQRVEALIWGVTLVIWGGGFLLGNYGMLPFAAWKLWPIFMLAAGAQMLWGGFAWQRHGWGCSAGRHDWENDWPKWPGPGGEANAAAGTAEAASGTGPGASAGPFAYTGPRETWLHMTAVFTETKRRVMSPVLARGEAWSVFGNCQLDLRPMGVPDHPVTVDANTVFGAVEIHIPSNWDVDMRGTGVFGAYENKTMPLAPDGKQRGLLIVTGMAIFGAVTIRN